MLRCDTFFPLIHRHRVISAIGIFLMLASPAAHAEQPPSSMADMPSMPQSNATQPVVDMSGMPGMGAVSTNATIPDAATPHAKHIREAAATKTDGSAQSTSAAAATQTAPFAVNGTAPAGISISNTPAPAPPPPVEERLGETIPSGIFLNDEHGKSVDVRSLITVPTIIVPIFLTCPAACNTLQSSMAATLPNVNLVPGKEFRVITVSFDETDTPAMAAHKKSNFLAAMNYTFPEEDWTYLTGDLPSIKKLMDSMGFPFIRTGPGNFSHPVGIIVLAPGGKISRYLYGQSFLPVDLTMACIEASEGKTGLSIKRMVSYCFTYNPESRTYVFSFMRVMGVIILFGAAVFLFVLLRGGKKKNQGNIQ